MIFQFFQNVVFVTRGREGWLFFKETALAEYKMTATHHF